MPNLLTRRDVLKQLGAASALGLSPLLSRGASAAKTGDRPHIFLIMTDQQKASANSIYGNRFVRTPTWERMAAEGITFERGYAQATICTPSRASIMTGTYPLVHRVLCHQNFAPPNLGQLAEFLSDDGYHCIGTGHYESTRGLTRGWRQTLDISGTPKLKAALHRLQEYGSRTVGWSAGEMTKVPASQGHAAVLNDELFGLLDKVDPEAEPLFVHVAYIEPHPPYFPPQGYFDREAMRSAPLPKGGSIFERPAWHEQMIKEYGSAEATDEDIHRLLGAYYGMINYVDGQIDRLLKYLEKRGILENSWIIMTADHGDYTGEKNFFTKSESAYECLQHVPLVVRAPGGKWHAGERVPDLVELIDLFPTILSAAKSQVPRQAQGHNLIEWMDTPARRPLRKATFAAIGGYGGTLGTTFPNGFAASGRRKGIVRSARSLDHVFIRDPDTGDEAYDLVNDPLELKDLLKAGRPKTEPIKALTRLMDQWEKTCAEKYAALGVIPGDRNFKDGVPGSPGDASWKRPAPGEEF